MSDPTTSAVCPTCSSFATITWSRIYGSGGRLVREDPERFHCAGAGCTLDPLELSKHFKDKGPAGRV